MGDHHAELVSTEALTEALAVIVGTAHVTQSARELASAGLSTMPIGRPPAAWIVRPGAASEIAEILRLAAERGFAAVPVGTATRRPHFPREARARVVVDLRRMSHVLHLDETSLIVHAQAGLTGLKLEELLARRGLTLGDFPPAALRSSLGGLFAVRTPGKSSPRHGFLEEAVLGLSAVLPDGRTIHTRVAPRRATGPDLSRVILGSEGTLGIITALVLRIHRRPEARRLDAYRFPSLANALAAVDQAQRLDVRPAAVRVYDAAEAAAHLGAEIAHGDEAVLVFATAGTPELAEVERDLLSQAALEQGATALGPGPAEIWWKRRTGHSVPGPVPPPPALQITAPTSRLHRVYRTAVDVAREAGRQVRAHISRFDDDGACVFVTILDGDRPDPQGRARHVVEHAIRRAGGFLVGEKDEGLAPYLEILRRELDPGSVLGGSRGS